ncbi:MAG: hypothetical protein ACP5E4_03430 [Candidatus Aenigmatarchaeota archaeon]
MDADVKEKIGDLKDQKWMNVEMSFEVLGVEPEITKKSLEEHVGKLRRVKDVFVFQADLSDVEEVEKPMKGVEKAYSQVAEIGAMVKDLKTLMAVSISYGPSSIEIIEPKKLEINVGEVQDVANMVAGIIHQIAAAGLGGIVATPKNPR